MGPSRATAPQSLLDEIAGTVLSATERQFMLDERRSTLELLDPAERDRYLGFAWNAADFPGGPVGPNEDRADRMFTALTRLRPERRVNQGDNAAVRADEFDAAMQARAQSGTRCCCWREGHTPPPRRVSRLCADADCGGR